VQVERAVRVCGQLAGDFVGQVGIHATHPERLGELQTLRLEVVLEFVALLADLGLDKLVLRGHRHILPGGHRERSRGQAGQAGEHDELLRATAPADASDQGHVGHKAVHGAEHRWPQPAAGDVAVLVPVCLTRLALSRALLVRVSSRHK